MLLKVLFWLFVAIDLAALGLFFVLGLAAAGPSKTSPLAVVLVMLVVPGCLLTAAIALFLKSPSPALRLLACLVVGAPFGYLAIQSVLSQQALLANPGGIWGETPLTRALGELEKDPTALERVRSLLAGGADPNAEGDMLPLALAIYAAPKVGDEPLRLLLDAGADPNRRNQFGRPAFFAATGTAATTALVELLLARGVDLQVLGPDGRSAAWSAVDTRNWPVALLLVERGAPVSGRSPMHYRMLDVLESEVRDRPPTDELRRLLALVRARTKD